MLQRVLLFGSNESGLAFVPRPGKRPAVCTSSRPLRTRCKNKQTRTRRGALVLVAGGHLRADRLAQRESLSPSPIHARHVAIAYTTRKRRSSWVSRIQANRCLQWRAPKRLWASSGSRARPTRLAIEGKTTPWSSCLVGFGWWSAKYNGLRTQSETTVCTVPNRSLEGYVS